MSTWNLSSSLQTKLHNLCSSLAEDSSTKNLPNAEENELIKQYWESHMKHSITSTTSPKEKTFNDKGDFFKPLLNGVWKQSFVADLISDDDSNSSNELDISCEEVQQVAEDQDVTQEDSFLAELSQMFN